MRSMSRNLVEIVGRQHEVGAPTALELLKEAIERRGDLVSGRSAHGRIELPARVTERIEPGHDFTAFHLPEIRTNRLIGSSADVHTSCPQHKVVAVDVRPVAEQAGRPPAIALAS